MADHLRSIAHYHGPMTAPVVFRKLFAWYIKGFRDVKPLKERAFRAKTTDEMLELITEFRENASYSQKARFCKRNLKKRYIKKEASYNKQ